MPIGRSASCTYPSPRNKVDFKTGNKLRTTSSSTEYDTNMCRTTNAESDSAAEGKLTGRHRSNSMPVTSKVTPKTSRRVIFPTLYESKCQASPLFKNQKREFVLGSEYDPKLIAPFSSPAGYTTQPQIKRETSVESKGRVNDNVSSVSLPQLPCLVESSQKIPPNPEQKSLGGEAAHARNFTRFRSLSSISNDDTDQQLKPQNIFTPKSETVTDQTKFVTPVNDHRDLLPPTSNLSDCPAVQTYSPTSTAGDLHRRLQPGPSILKNKCIHTVTPTSSYEYPPQAPATGKQIIPNSPTKTPPPTTNASISFGREKMFLRKSMSDSCIDCLKKLTLGEGFNNTEEIFRVSSSPYLSCRSKTEHDDQASNKAFRRYSWNFTRHASHDEFKKPSKKRIRFDPRVWVHEVQKSAVDKVWYNESDLQRFKKEAIQRIKTWTLKHTNMGNEMIPTGTGRIVTRECRLPKSVKAFYTNPALSLDAEDDTDVAQPCLEQLKRKELLQKEIQKVLLVDCHDIFLCLLSKDIKAMMPHVLISTAYTVKEAQEKIEQEKQSNQSTHGFDMIVVEHRLKQISRLTKQQQVQQSGAILIQRITNELNGLIKCAQNNNISSGKDRFPVLIGMSAYMDQDEKMLRESGCDMVWTKPPPRMNDELRDKILHATMKKRRRKLDRELGFDDKFM